MKPLLVIGLGNPLMGDDGVGCAVAERLAGDPRLPDDAEVVCGGSDLLRYAAQIEGRRRVVVIDAVQDDAEPGSVVRFDREGWGLRDRQDHAHHLSAVQAVELIRTITPVRCTLLGIAIGAVRMGEGLSAVMEARMPAILERVLEEVGATLPISDINIL